MCFSYQNLCLSHFSLFRWQPLMLDQRENMFQNIFYRDYFGFNGPFDCAKQINIQNTLLIKLPSACLQKQNTRPIYGERHLKKYSMPLNHVHYKPICLVSSLSLPHRQFCFFLYFFFKELLAEIKVPAALGLPWHFHFYIFVSDTCWNRVLSVTGEKAWAFLGN